MSGASPPSNGIGWVMGSSPDANGAGFHYGSKGRSAGASSLGARPKGASPSAGGGGPLVSTLTQHLSYLCSQQRHAPVGWPHWDVSIGNALCAAVLAAIDL